MRSTTKSWLVATLSLFATPVLATEHELTPKEEVESLMNSGLEFAKKMLSEQGEFYPFGFAMSPGGEEIVISAKGGTDRPSSRELIDLLQTGFREGAAASKYKATAIFFDVFVTPPGGTKTDAIEIGLEHQAGYCATVFLPYRKTWFGKFEFGELFANRRKGTVFATCQ